MVFTKGHKINIGEKNGMWKGDNTKYRNIHAWIRKHAVIPILCQECNKMKKLDIANTTGIYNRDFNNYRFLCRSCHNKLDNRIENITKHKSM